MIKKKKKSIVLITAIFALIMAIGSITVYATGFTDDGGKYSSWDNVNKSFTVPAKYANSFTTTKATVEPFGDTYNNVKALEDLRTTPQTFFQKDEVYEGYTTRYYCYNADTLNTASGIKVKNLQIYSEAKKDIIDVDMKVTIANIAGAGDYYGNKGSYIFIEKAPNGTPNVFITGINGVQIRYEYFLAGTNTPVKVATNMTFGDVDLGQYITFPSSMGLDYMCVAPDSNLRYETGNGTSGEWERFYASHTDSEDRNNVPQDAVGVYFDESSYLLTYGEESDFRNDVRAVFTVSAYSLADIEPNSPFKTVSDADEDRVKANTLTSLKDEFVYRVNHAVAKGYSPDMYFTKYEIFDDIPDYLDIKEVRVFRTLDTAVNGTDVTGNFDITKTGNKVVAKAKSSTLSEASFYGRIFNYQKSTSLFRGKVVILFLKCMGH